ncbi:MAG: serine hydrolase [Lachnospiraceae bacterium]|nr:serine hydrolase [Lachnospiraceae bacterium]
MESYSNDWDEDREYRIRYERRQRMRRERQRRMRRRQMLQRLLFLGVFCVVMVLAVIAIKSGRKAGEEKGTPQDQAVEAVEQPDRLEIEKIIESMMEEEAGEPETEETEAEVEVPVYRFEETEDTAFIDSADVISTHAILVDESTDAIVASKGARERIMPASMTKVLTVLVAAEHIPEEKLDDTFPMTLEITDYAYVNDCSSVGFLDGEEVPVRDLFYGTAMHSGGDAALGLAFYVAGSQEAFVEMMNQKLEDLGIAGSTHFTNCVGIYDEAHYSTVYDMAVIMKAAARNDLCREVMSEHIYTTKPTREHPDGIEISNWFLRKIEDKDTGGEVLCAKTGYIVQSKNCAVSYEIFADKTPYICVTAGSSSSWRCIYDHVEIYNRYIPS